MNYELYMTRGIFITGTDTGVGKTYIAERIVVGLRQQGVDVGVMKPAETGCRLRDGRLLPADALRLMSAAECKDSLELVNPYRFRQPLAPAVAAGLTRRKIDPKKIVSAFRTLAARHDFMVVEGAGGILVPLSIKYAYGDLASAIKLPVIIVARPGLGTINHTLLTVSALQLRRIAIAGIIINHAGERQAGLVERTSPSVIAEISKMKILGTVRHGEEKLEGIVEQILSLPFSRAGK